MNLKPKSIPQIHLQKIVPTPHISVAAPKPSIFILQNQSLTLCSCQNRLIFSPLCSERISSEGYCQNRFTLLSSPLCSRIKEGANIIHFIRTTSQENNTRITYMAPNGKQAPLPTRYAVVTGANKGIGLETVRQLAKAGVTVVLTARDEKRGTQGTKSLQESGLSNVVFHQLDVRDPQSIESLAKFITTQFGRLDILVNNAGASGVVVDGDALKAMNIKPETWLAGKAVNMVQDVIKTTYKKAKECLDTNYYGVKNVTEVLLPLLQLSTSGARIVNVSSLRSELRRIPNEQTRKELGDIETLTEEKIDKILQKFLHDVQEDAIEANGWQKMLPAYSLSKATLNAYTRVLAKKYPKMCINCVHPGFVDTDLNWHTGTMTVEEGAEGSVMLALLPDGGPTGCYFDRTQVAEF